MSDQEIHDLRGEVGGVRADIKAMRDEMRLGFAAMDGRVRKVEDALIEAKATERVRAEFIAQGVPMARPPIMKDSRTYAVGGIGTALALIVVEFLKAWGTR